MSDEVSTALAIARQLIAAGIPVFAAAPDLEQGEWNPAGGHNSCGYWLPPKWQSTYPTTNWLDSTVPGFEGKAWRPGWALCAVMGHGLDGLDIDPRHGGDQSRAELESVWPRSYAKATTPSGGTHDLVASLGLASGNGDFRPGLDIKAGTADGKSRGFLFIAPTVRASKTTGELLPYRWVQPPDLDGLGQPDDSGKALADLVREVRASSRTPRSTDLPSDPGEAYEALSEAKRLQVDRWIAGAVNGVQEQLRAAQGWGVGQVDDQGRGWERLCADAAFRLARIARAGWNDLSLEQAREAFLGAAPTDETWTPDDLRAKWGTQVMRGDPAPWPARLDGEERGVSSVRTLDDDEEGVGTTDTPPTEPTLAELVTAKYPVLDWHELWSKGRSEPDWLCEPLLAAGKVVALYSPAKTGKSLLCLEIAAALAAGRPVLGNAAREPVRVLYVDLENSEDDLLERLIDLGYVPDDLANLRYLSFPSLPALDSRQGGLELLTVAQCHDAALVVLDTVSRVIEGEEDKSDTFRALYRHALMPLKAEGRAVLRLDHSGKDLARGQRGSTGKVDDVDAVWSLVKRTPTVFDLRRTHSRSRHGAEHVELTRLASPLRHDVPTAGGPTPVDELVRQLAVLAVPLDAGRPTCRDALASAGITATNTVLADAVRQRREAQNCPRTVSEDSDSDGSEGPVRATDREPRNDGLGQSTDSPDSEPTGHQSALSVPPPLQGRDRDRAGPHDDQEQDDPTPVGDRLLPPSEAVPPGRGLDGAKGSDIPRVAAS